MQTMLHSLHGVTGVIGGLISDENGEILAHSFPPVFDISTLQTITSILNDNLVGLRYATGNVKFLDFRFELGRVIVKPLPQYNLLLLCESNLNLQLLTISVNVATKKIEKLTALKPPKPVPLTSALNPKQLQTQKSAIETSKPDRYDNFGSGF
jgi:predicted regulator of Ras-like GTPase activity (Roadblock/LC7/MglB family)